MRKVYLLLFACFSFTCSIAQVSVTATAGTTGPTVYSNLKSAFDAINAGTHRGVVDLAITANTTETVSAVLNGSGTGASSYTSVSIKPSGVGVRTISGDAPGPLIDLDGADNVTIDGNLDNSGLIISNISQSNAGNVSTIRFINDATGNTIQNATILGSGTNALSGTIYFSIGLVTGNNNNTISLCNISDAGGNTPVNGLFALGTAGLDNTNNTVSNNNVSNYFNPALPTGGVLLSTGNSGWTISGNKLFQTTTRTFTAAATHRAIQVAAGNGYNITGNTIGYASASGTGSYTLNGAVASRFIAIDLAVGTTTATSVQNNTITNFNFTTSSGASTVNGIWCGINIGSGNVNVGTTAGNLIGSNTGTSSIVVVGTSSGPAAVAITALTSGVLNIANNSIGAMDLIPTGVLSGTLIGIQTQGTLGTVNVTNNIIGNSTPNNMRVGTLGVTTGSGISRGIINANTGTVNISSNTIRNLTHYSSSSLGLFRGIEYQQGTGSITSNSVSSITAYGTSTSVTTHEGMGIIVTSSLAGIVIDNNRIFNLNANSTGTAATVISGIYLGTVNGISITRNTIYGFSNASTSVSPTTPGIIAGIFMRDANIANPVTIANNMISLGNGQISNIAMIGVWNQSPTAANYTLRLYYNTINIEGTAVGGTQPTFGYYRGDFSAAFTTPTVDIKNNIFTNTRSSGGKHYAIANSYPSLSSSNLGWGPNNSNYNILNANSATIGYWSGDRDFASWKTFSSGDGNSLSGVPVVYYNSANDLHLANNANAAVDGVATPLAAITTDMDNDVRSPTNPDPGADEFTASTVVAIKVEYFKGRKNGTGNELNWKASCTSAGVNFEIEKSQDARLFNKISGFSATRERCSQPFDFTDNNSLPGTNYYRLKMTELDGTVSYSNVIAIINKESGLVILGLNPNLITSGPAVLNVSAAQKMDISISVSDLSGKILQKQNATLLQGSNSLKLGLGNLVAGVYQLTVISGNERKTLRFVKR